MKAIKRLSFFLLLCENFLLCLCMKFLLYFNLLKITTMTTEKRDHTDFYEKLLAEILNCGYGDISYFADLCKDFNVDVFELGVSNNELLLDNECLQLNVLINEVFTIALNQIANELSMDIDWDVVKIKTQYADSHLYINEEKMWCIDDIKEHYETLC